MKKGRVRQSSESSIDRLPTIPEDETWTGEEESHDFGPPQRPDNPIVSPHNSSWPQHPPRHHPHRHRPGVGAREGDEQDDGPRSCLPVQFILLLFAIAYCPLADLTREYVYQCCDHSDKYDPVVSTCYPNSTDIQYLQLLESFDLGSESTKWGIYVELPAIILGFFSNVILGTLSDKFGRKVVILSVILTCSARTALLLFANILHLPKEYIFIGSAIEGATGSWMSFLGGCFAITADLASEENRTFRLCVNFAVVLIGGAAARFGIAHWVRCSGSTYPLIAVEGTFLLCLLSAVVFLRDISGRISTISYKRTLSDHYRRTVNFIKYACGRTRRLKLGCLIFALFNSGMALAMESHTNTVYLLSNPFCWDLNHAVQFTLISICAIAFLSSVTIHFFTSWGVADTELIVMSILSAISSCLLQTFASEDVMLYLGKL